MARQNCAFVYTIHLQSLQVYKLYFTKRPLARMQKKYVEVKFLKKWELV